MIDYTYNNIINRLNDIYICLQIYFINHLKKIGFIVRKNKIDE